MPKLHEILAVEGDLEGQYKKIIEEATSIFKKGEHFIGFTANLMTSQYTIVHQPLQNPIHDNLPHHILTYTHILYNFFSAL